MNTRRIYYIIRAVMGLSFHMMFTASVIYRIDIANLEVYQLILLGTAQELAIFSFEVPTGIVADLKSRRLSVIIGLLIIGTGFLLEGFTTYFAVIFIAQIVWAFGYTFISGALDSWVTDELENKNTEHVLIVGAQHLKGFGFLGIVFAALIGLINVRYAIFLSGALFISVGLMAMLVMKEHNFTKHIHKYSLIKEYYIHLTKGLKHIKNHSVLRLMFFAMLFYGLYSEGIDRTNELNILDNLGFRNLFDLEPIVIVSIIAALIELSGLIILGIVKRTVVKGYYVALWAMNFTIIMIGGIVVFAYMPNMYFALLGYLLFSFARQGTYPLLNVIVVRNTPSKIKATVLSSFGQLDAIGQLLSGVIMVSATLLAGLNGMYTLTAILLLVPVFALFKVFQLKHG